MREKQCELSIVVFTVTMVLLFGFSLLTSAQVFADNGFKGKGNQKEWQNKNEPDRERQKHQEEMQREQRKHYEEQNRESRKHREEMRREDRKHHEEQDRHNYYKRQNYQKHSGYRERPYDRHRLYVNYDHKGHRYDYHGHWRSWAQWDRYARKYPHIYRHGHYYRENAHLMFRFCDPGTGNCFFFSIGS